MLWVTLVSSILLTVLTGFYVVFTYKLLRHSVNASEQGFRISLLPHLNCVVQRKGPLVYIETTNPGSNQAFDVDLWILSTYNERYLPIDRFKNEYIKPQHRELNIEIVDGGHYSIFERSLYYVFPVGQKANMKLEAPEPPTNIHLLLQFRDSMGTHYSQYLWFLLHEGTRYKLGSIEPRVLTPTARIIYGIDRHLEADDGNPLPDHVAGEFMWLWKAAISGSSLIDSEWGVEDRGIWDHL